MKKIFHPISFILVFIVIMIGLNFKNTPIEEYYYQVGSIDDSSSNEVDYWTALQINTYAGNLEKVKSLILESSDVNARTKNESKTALMMAAALGYVEIMDLLLENDANINQRDNKGFTALMSAVTNSRLDIAKLLVDRGADVFIRGQDEKMFNEVLILAFSIEFKEYELTRSLLKLGVNINGRINIGSYENWTTLMIAIQSADYKAVELLLTNGADFDLLDGQGRSALVLGILYDQKKIIKLLLEYGADPGTVINGNGTSIDVARKLGKDEIVTILQGYISK